MAVFFVLERGGHCTRFLAFRALDSTKYHDRRAGGRVQRIVSSKVKAGPDGCI